MSIELLSSTGTYHTTLPPHTGGEGGLGFPLTGWVLGLQLVGLPIWTFHGCLTRPLLHILSFPGSHVVASSRHVVAMVLSLHVLTTPEADSRHRPFYLGIKVIALGCPLQVLFQTTTFRTQGFEGNVLKGLHLAM